MMLVTFVAIRMDPSGSGRSQLTAVSTTTLPAFWVVRPGDTFTSIARRTGLRVARLEGLNPYAEPAALGVGALIRLRPSPAPAPAARFAAGSRPRGHRPGH